MAEIAALEPTFDADKANQTGGRPDLLQLCRNEMIRAVGFDQDAELKEERERALLYRKGDVSADIPTLPNRSKAVSTDVSDAIETVKPDLIEIFIGGDDVVSFIPVGPEDVEAAKQETAYLHKVAFQDNPGFLNFCTALDDALSVKQGIFHWEWKEDRNEQVEEFTGKNAVELQLAMQDGEVSNVRPDDMGEAWQGEEPTYSFTLTKVKDNSRAMYWAVAPDDFAASADTVNIAETTYCCERQRPRVQDLIADGFREDLVRNLEPYTFGTDQQLQLARDTAGEHSNPGSITDDSSDDLRQVEIRKHCIRTLGEDNKLELWCVYTNSAATVELYREKINAIPYASGSPFLVAHRLIGRSLTDMLIEVMKLKTAVIRMVADSGYFALNQRFEVAMDQANDFTISDLLRNEPSSPVRSKTGTAIRALNNGQLNFDAYRALEYFSTVAESRTGVVRNAQGLNPDTLHDTAKGAMMLLSAAQKRTRMIARVLAETLIKPLFLGLHACIRENSEAENITQLLGKWVPVNPSKWAERNNMTVEVGLGAAGKDAEIAAMTLIQNDQKAIVEAGGLGILVTEENIYKAATDKAKKLGVKQPDEYFTDPATPEAQQAKAARAQQPNPEVMKVQAEQQLAQMKHQGEMELGIAKAQIEKEIQNNKSQMQAAANAQQQELEHQRETQKQQDAIALKQLEFAANERIEQEKLASAERIAIETARIKNEGMIAAAEAKSRSDIAAASLQYQMANETKATETASAPAPVQQAPEVDPREQMALEHELAREKMQHEVQLERDKAAAMIQIEQEKAAALAAVPKPKKKPKKIKFSRDPETGDVTGASVEQE